MNALTPAAREALARQLDAMRPHLVAAGADPDEVVEDLGRRLAEELSGRPDQSIGVEELRALLARFGPVGDVPEATARTGAVPDAGPSPRRAWTSGALGFFAVVLPLITIGVEVTLGWCQPLLDPIPTAWHVLLCLFVPLGNAWALRALGADRPLPPSALAANGAAAGVSGFYAVLFLPLTPLGVLGLLFVGLGLLPLTPALSFAATLALRRRLRRRARTEGLSTGRPFWTLALAALALLFALDAPRALTRLAVARALSGDAPVSRGAVALLRRFGHEPTLREMSYGLATAGTDILGAVFGAHPQPLQARAIYFRAFGRAFNVEPPPRMRTARGAALLVPEDWEQGGTHVGQVRRGLALASSRIDGSVDPLAALAYLEWTFELRNDTHAPQEGRAEFELPRGAVVSRVTLWVAGEEREAAFAARSQAREAYESVVRRQRDPILVTTRGRGRVLVQCFPVPPGGGVLKGRLGMTVPLEVPTLGRARITFPRIVERNFRIPPELQHAVWIEGDGAVATVPGWLAAESGPPGTIALRGQITDVALSAAPEPVEFARPGTATEAWTLDSRSKEAAVVRQTLRVVERPPAGAVVVVIDGSASVAEHAAAIGRALGRARSRAPAAVLLASDEVVALDDTQRAGTWVDQISRHAFVGGQDNLPALERGWDLAARAPNGVVIWVHGPNPERLASAEGLRQRWERRPDGPTLVTLAAAQGPNEVLRELADIDAVQTASRLGALEQDMAREISEWGAPSARVAAERTRVAGIVFPAAATRTSDHLARLWAFDEIAREARGRGGRDRAVLLAAQYQLVTSVSGAVVLETAADFARHGLQPASVSDVPVIPEPETWVLLVVALTALAVACRRTRRPRCAGV